MEPHPIQASDVPTIPLQAPGDRVAVPSSAKPVGPALPCHGASQLVVGPQGSIPPTSSAAWTTSKTGLCLKSRLPHHCPFSSLATLCSPGTTDPFLGLLAQRHRVFLHVWALQESHGTYPGCSWSARNTGVTWPTGLNTCFEIRPEEARVVPASPLPGAHRMISAWEGRQTAIPNPACHGCTPGSVFLHLFLMPLPKEPGRSKQKMQHRGKSTETSQKRRNTQR